MKEVLTKKENIPFTQIANAVLDDRTISWKAKGIFSYIYSKPKGWDFSGDRMTNDSTDGRDSTYSGVKELETSGYLIRTRKPDGRVEYDISYRKDREPLEENPQEPDEENPQVGKSPMGKSRSISNKYSLSNKDLLSNKEKAATAALRPDSFFQKLKGKERADEGYPMTLQEFVLLCRGATYRHIRIIAEYADEKKLQFNTRGQWREFGRRNMVVARRLTPFNDRQMAEAMEKITKDSKDKGGFISKWTLETLEKYLDQP